MTDPLASILTREDAADAAAVSSAAGAGTPLDAARDTSDAVTSAAVSSYNAGGVAPVTLRGLTVRLLHTPAPSLLDAEFARARAAGATGVALVPHEYVLLGDGNQVIAPPWAPGSLIWPDVGQMAGGVGNSTPLPVVEEAAKMAQVRGLAVWIKPHIDCGWLHDGVWGQGGWRYYLAVDADPGAWLRAYSAFLRPYVDLARRRHLGLVIGCELGTVTRALGAAFWAAVVRGVRAQGFYGPLTYAANWGEEVLSLRALWADPAVTYIGCDWYAPARQWADQAAALYAMCRQLQKAIVFTEAGAANWAGCADEPGADPPPDAQPDDAAQLAWWQRFVHSWPSAGRIAWESALLGLPQPGVSHNVLRNPAVAAVALGAPGPG